MAMPAVAYPPPSEPERFTEAYIDAAPEDGRRYEIIDGSLLVTPAPTAAHNRRGFDLCAVLHAAAPPGWLAVYEVGIHAPGRNVIADVAVLKPESPQNRNWQETSAVGLVVEIESPTTRMIDRTLKATVYAETGIPAYWRVEQRADGPHVNIYELTDKGVYRQVTTVRPGQTWLAEIPYPVKIDPGAWGS